MDYSEKKYLLLDHISGKLIREIRESKGYTQEYVARDIMRQSTYSKIEREETEPSASKLFLILDRLEMTVEEFLFIQGEYAHTEKGTIVYNFINQKYNIPSILEEYKLEVDAFLRKHDDTLIKDIQAIYEGLIILTTTHSMKLARKYVEPVWNRIESFDEWHLTEIYLVNNILYFFSVETAIHIARRAIDQLKKYIGFYTTATLRFNFQFNLIYLLMDNKQFDKALETLEELIPYTKDLKKHDMMAVCYTRKGVSLLKTNHTSGQEWIDKGMNILEAIEETELKNLVQREIDRFMK